MLGCDASNAASALSRAVRSTPEDVQPDTVSVVTFPADGESVFALPAAAITAARTPAAKSASAARVENPLIENPFRSVGDSPQSSDPLPCDDPAADLLAAPPAAVIPPSAPRYSSRRRRLRRRRGR